MQHTNVKNLIKKSRLPAMIALSAGLSIAGEVGAQSQSGEQQAVLEEVLVSARRREESVQEIPVTVSALGSEDIYRENITDIFSLTTSVSGVNFTSSGGTNNTVFSIRGRSRGVFGNALPAVTTYVNEVPLSTWGGAIPTYDMASLEVLKGPQGTLFGRNSSAGAVLVTTARPDYEFGGYVTVKVGEYSTRVLEGAINVPVVENKLAVRLSGQLDRRDGYVDEPLLMASDEAGNHDRDNYRVSILFDPVENFSNLTVYEKNNMNERSVAPIPILFTPGEGAPAAVPYYNGSFLIDPTAPGGIVPCGGSPTCDIGAFFAQQEAAGLRTSYTDIETLNDTELTSWGNITSLDIGGITVKNIFGYREVYTRSFTDIDGTIFPMIHADSLVILEQTTNELQVSGDAMDGGLSYIAGLFYLKSKPDGPGRLAIQQFAQFGTPFNSPLPAPFNGAFGPSDFYTDTSKAVYGQVSYDLTDSLSLDIGLRHTKDKSENCPVSGTSINQPAPTIADCTQSVETEFDKTTYTIGINYQLNDSTLLYAVTRSGYRAGGVNSPILGGTLMPYQSYEPETVEDIEIGYKSDWNIGEVIGRLNVSLFYSQYEDVHFAIPSIAARQILPGGVDGDGDLGNDPTGGLFYDNAGEATVSGIEFEAVAQLTANLKLSLIGSYLEKDLDADITLPSNFGLLETLGINIATQKDVESFVFLAAPDWSYNLQVDYTLPVSSDYGEVVVSANYFEMSDVAYGGNLVSDNLSKADVRIDWFNLFESSVDLAVYVSNITDEEELIAPASSGSGLGFNSGFFSEPRMWGASLRYSF